jgi:hypothetical protein
MLGTAVPCASAIQSDGSPNSNGGAESFASWLASNVFLCSYSFSLQQRHSHMIVQGLPDVKEVEDEWDIVLCEGGCWSDTRRGEQ